MKPTEGSAKFPHVQWLAHSAWRSYGLAVLLSVVALGLRYLLNPVLVHDQGKFVLSALAVVLASGLGGLGPGLLATLLSTLGLGWLMLPTGNGFLVSDQLALGLFVLTGLGISYFGGNRLKLLLNLTRSETLGQDYARRVLRLQNLSESLARAQSLAEVARVLVEQGAGALGATQGVLNRISEDGKALEPLYFYGYPVEVMERYPRIPLEFNSPISDAARKGQIVALENRADQLRAYPHIAKDWADAGVEALVAVPLLLGEQLVGALGYSLSQSRSWTPDDHEFLQAVARQGAQVIERVRLLEAERQAQAELRTITDSVPGLIAYVDCQQRYRFVNAEFGAWFNTSPQALVGRTMQEVLGAAYAGVEEQIRRALAGEKLSFETTVDYPIGTRTVMVQYVPDLREGAVQGFHVLVTDISERKNVEEALRVANQRFRIAEEASNGFLYDYDLSTGAETRSEGFGKVLGYQPEEVPGGGAVWESLMHPEDVPRVRAETEQAVRELSGAHYEYRIRHKDGRWLWVLDNNRVICDAQGRASRIVGSIVDITERKLVEKRLSSLQAVTAKLAKTQSLPEVRQVILQEVLESLEANVGRLRLVVGDELVLEESIQKVLIQPQTLQRTQRIRLGAAHPATDAIKNMAPIFIRDAQEYIQRYPDLAEDVRFNPIQAHAQLPLKREGTVFGVLSFNFSEPCAWDEGQQEFALALADQTAVAYERARLFENLRKSENFNRTVLESSPDCLKVLDAQGQLLSMNANGLCLMEIDDFSTFAGRPWAELWPEDCRNLIEEALKVAAAGGTGRFQGFCPTAKGTPKWWDVVVRAARDEEGKPLQLIAVSRDITEQKLHEEDRLKRAALEERQKLARELHDSVSQALYGIALGIKTTLGVKGMPDKATESLLYASRMTETAMAEMKNLIFELRPESLEQEGLVAALRKQIRAQELRHNLRFELQLEEPALELPIKETLYRIAQEALNNIVKHAQARTVSVGLHMKDGVRLAIRDDGQGFDPGQSFPGHLGLVSMQERAMLVGGELLIESKPGHGTTVQVYLPALVGSTE